MAAGTHGVAAACAALPGRVSTGRGHHIDLVPLRRHDLQGVEGGVWQAEAGSLAYAFPTYEGTGEKTDLPQAEQPSIKEAAEAAVLYGAAVERRQEARSQVLLLRACPLPGPIPNLAGVAAPHAHQRQSAYRARVSQFGG